MPGHQLRTSSRHWVLLAICLLLTSCAGPELQNWHTVQLDREYDADGAAQVNSLQQYLALEEELFRELEQKIYAGNPTGARFALHRFSRGSLSDPLQLSPNWNRSFLLRPGAARGGVLLLHGMSDSPYSLRALGETLQQQGYLVLGLRLPGHGTAPSGMLDIRWEDMAAITRIGMQYLGGELPGKPLHIIGYSTGAALALDYALEAANTDPQPSSLVLVSPAVGISAAAALASVKRGLSHVPGLQGMAWLDVEEEFDPYKYNSFATNAADQVHRLTRSVANRVQQRADAGQTDTLPPLLVLKSTVDATVTTDAVVDRLLMLQDAQRHELVLFDVNRFAPGSTLLVSDPGPLTRRLLRNSELPFALTLVGNSDEMSREVSAYYKRPFSRTPERTEPLGLSWPPGVFSLSHVALPFPPDDPLYGAKPPADTRQVFLGQQAMQGERRLLRISPNFLLRLRHNPFYDYLEQRTVDWLDSHGSH